MIIQIRKPHLFSLAILLAIFSLCGNAAAQFTDSMGAAWSQPLQAYASTAIWSSIFYRTYNRSSSKSTTPRSSSPAVKPSNTTRTANPIDEASLKFRSTGTYIKTRELSDQLGSTQAERDQYFKMMNAVLTAFDAEAAKAGRKNDIPSALSYFLAENARIYHGQTDLSDAQFFELRNRIAQALAADGSIGSMTDRQKQEMYETLIAYTGLTQYGYEESLKAGNQQMAQGYQKLAGMNLQAVTKLSPDSIDLGTIGK